uniref:WD_REPEATS_REGION domain-containing protein n=1 Tax=Syphacia muris TaxID=451379 RepID=A0A0N5AWW9_9BILA
MTVLTEASTNYFQNIIKVQKAHNREIRKVSFIKDPHSQNVLMVTCSHDSLKIWSVTGDTHDTMSLAEIQEVKGWRNGVQDFDITNDGKLAATVGVDSVLHQTTFMDDTRHTVDKTEKFDIGFMEIWFICIIPNQIVYATTSYSGSLVILDTTGKVIKTAPFNGVKQISALDCSPDGKSIAVANNEGIVTIVDSENLSSRFNFEAHALKVRAVSFSPDSKRILTGSDDKTVKLYEILNTKAEAVSTFCGHRNVVTAVQFDHSLDGQRFASCSNDSCVIIWSAQSAKPLHIFKDLHEGVISSICFSFDNQFLASVGEDRTICVSQVDNGSRKMEEKFEESARESELQSQMHDGSNDNIHQYPSDLFVSEHKEEKEVKNVEDELLGKAGKDVDAVSDEEKQS